MPLENPEKHVGHIIVAEILKHLRWSLGCAILVNGKIEGKGFGSAAQFVEAFSKIESFSQSIVSNKQEMAGRLSSEGHPLWVNTDYLAAIMKTFKGRVIWIEDELLLVLQGKRPWTSFDEDAEGVLPIGRIIASAPAKFTGQCGTLLDEVKIKVPNRSARKLSDDERSIALDAMRKGIFMHGLERVVLDLPVFGGDLKKLKVSAYKQLEIYAISQLPTEEDLEAAKEATKENRNRRQGLNFFKGHVEGLGPIDFIYLMSDLLPIFQAKLDEAIDYFEAQEKAAPAPPVLPKPYQLPEAVTEKLNQLINKEIEFQDCTEEELIRRLRISSEQFTDLRQGILPHDEEGKPIQVDLLVNSLYRIIPMDRSGEQPIPLTEKYYLDLLMPVKVKVNSNSKTPA
jgi:hypothetical protein